MHAICFQTQNISDVCIEAHNLIFLLWKILWLSANVASIIPVFAYHTAYGVNWTPETDLSGMAKSTPRTCDNINNLSEIPLQQKSCKIMPTPPHFYLFELAFILAWVSNHIPSQVWDIINNPFPNFDGATAEVSKWISNSILHFRMNIITFPCCNWLFKSCQ